MATLTPVFGQIVTPPTVKNALVAHLKAWMDDYLAAIEDADGCSPIERPQDYSVVAQLPPPHAPLPHVVVACAGHANVTGPDQDGEVSFTYGVSIAVFCRDTGQVTTSAMQQVAEQAERYGTAVSLLLWQHPQIAEGMRIVGSTGDIYTRLTDQARSRTLQVSESAWDLKVDASLNADMGPAEPTQTDPDPTVDDFTVNITKEAVAP